MHRFGVLIFDSKARIKVLKGNPQYLDQQQVQTFYKLSLYNIIDIPKSTLRKRVKKLAPEVQPENCSKNEARIYAKLPRFSPTKPVRHEYDLYLPNSESVCLFNSQFESGNLEKAIRQSEFEYVVYLDADTNSQNFSQWFYFSVMGR